MATRGHTAKEEPGQGLGHLDHVTYCPCASISLTGKRDKMGPCTLWVLGMLRWEITKCGGGLMWGRLGASHRSCIAPILASWPCSSGIASHLRPRPPGSFTPVTYNSAT